LFDNYDIEGDTDEMAASTWDLKMRNDSFESRYDEEDSSQTQLIS